MAPDEFKAVSIAILRSTVGWQTAIARRLMPDATDPENAARSVRRWLKTSTPPWVDEKLRELMGGTEASVWPRDEWLIGDGVTADGRHREYIAHLAPPRFVARIVAVDVEGLPEPDEEPADILSGTVFSSDEYVLCEIDWIDEVAPGQITHLLNAAADAIEEQGEREAG